VPELPKGVSEQVDALKVEIEALEREARVGIPAEMQDAQAVGPVRENADLYLLAGRAHYLQGRLLTLRQRLRALLSLDTSRIPKDRAGYGSVLELEDLDTGVVRRIRLISPEEVTSAGEACSLLSPLGKALAGKRPGDEVEVDAPGGWRAYRIRSLRTLLESGETEPPPGSEVP